MTPIEGGSTERHEHLRARLGEARRLGLREQVEILFEAMEVMMAVTDELAQALTDLEAQEATLEGAEAGLVTEVKALAEQVISLETQIAAGGTVTAADLQPLADRATALTTKLGALGAADSTATETAAADVQRTVYTFSGDPSTIDTTAWLPSGEETAEPTPRPLYFFAGDTAPGDTKGDGLDGGAWVRYIGPTQPAPEPAP